MPLYRVTNIYLIYANKGLVWEHSSDSLVVLVQPSDQLANALISELPFSPLNDTVLHYSTSSTALLHIGYEIWIGISLIINI